MTQKAEKAKKFLELSIPAIHRGLKRGALRQVFLYAEALKAEDSDYNEDNK